MSERRILAIDPGHTIGYALLDWVVAAPVIINADQVVLAMDKKQTTFLWADVSLEIAKFSEMEPDVIVMEDYRVYLGKADIHIGLRCLTSELIGAICQEAAISEIPVVRLMAGVKRNWPIARLNSRYKQYKIAPAPHSRDALLLALYYIEHDLGWTP